MLMVYFSYPYSDNPKERSGEIKGKVKQILKANPNLTPIIPHLAFDGLFDYPEGFTHPEILVMELEAISRSDLLAYDPEHLSTGVMWEIAFAKWLGKKVVTFKELMVNGVESRVEK